MKTKKIIGWNLKKDCEQYADAAQKIMAVTWGTPKYHVTVDYCIEALKKAGVLELWFEPLYEEEQYKVGDWVLLKIDAEGWGSGHGINNKVVKIKEIGDRLGHSAIFFDLDGKEETTHFNKGIARKATEAEIKEAENALLLEEAKKRYPVGCKVDQRPAYNGAGDIYIIKNNTVTVNDEGSYINMVVGGTGVYNTRDKIWAPIITTPQIEINGYTAKFSEDSVSFGCQTFSKDLIRQIKKIQDLGVDITKEKDNIKEIVKHFKG